MDSLGTAVSVALQYGVPIEGLVNKFTHQRFEPAGMTTNRDIPFAKSLVDYIFRWMGMEFIPGYREENAPRRDAGPVLADSDDDDLPLDPGQRLAGAVGGAESSRQVMEDEQPWNGTECEGRGGGRAPVKPDPALGGRLSGLVPTHGPHGNGSAATARVESRSVSVTSVLSQTVAGGGGGSGGGGAGMARRFATRTTVATSALSVAMQNAQADAPACDVCGAITVRSGTCYKCLNCGASMGCS